jgi:hypothetical protein
MEPEGRRRRIPAGVVLAVAAVLSACAERGAVGWEYRWSSESTWHTDPTSRPAGDDELQLRTVVSDEGARPVVRIYQPPSLVGADIDGVPIELGNRWAFKQLPPGSAGKRLTLRYRTRFPIVNPVVDFGSDDVLPGTQVRADLAPFGIASAMLLLGLGALASLLVRRSRPWLYFGSFAVCIGTMTVLEVQNFYSLLPLAGLRDPVHELAIYGIAASFAAFNAEVFGGRWARSLRGVAASAMGCAAIMLALHVFGVLPGRQLRIIAELHVLAGLVLALVTAFSRRGDARARVLLLGVGLLFLTAIPDLLTGIGLLDVNVLPWGIAGFVLCMGQVLYQHYGEKEQELEKRVREMVALNTELRHQIAERSRDLARNPARGAAPGLPQLGSVVAGRYEILRALGAGAMGQVFEVVRSSDGARFALKVMLGQTGQDVVRFAREAEIAARLDHPNLVPVLDVGVGSWGSPFIVMELVHGGHLAERKLEPDAVGSVLASVARGLAELHAHGIVHRDLKPTNVLVSENDGRMQVKLADFGIARALPSAFEATQRASQHATKDGAFLGTPLYMAPEQAVNAERVTPAADMFAFGVMAYELWTGAVPFPTPVVFLALAQMPLPEPPSFDACVRDAALREVLRSCLAALPGDRPSAQAVADALAAAYGLEDTSRTAIVGSRGLS